MIDRSKMIAGGPDTAPPAPQPLRPERVLVVQGDPWRREMLRRCFRRARYRVVEAANGEAAVVELSTGGRIDAVVVGSPLPDGSPIALVRWIREVEGDDLPVLVVSDNQSPAWAVRAYDTGADGVVAGPIDLELLARKLDAVLRRRGRSRGADGPHVVIDLRDRPADDVADEAVVWSEPPA